MQKHFILSWVLLFLLFPMSLLAQKKSHRFKDKKPHVQEQRQDGYTLTNPLLDCEPSLNYIPPFKKELRDYISEQLKNHTADRISVYFRQLNNGYSFGVNADSKFNPASLLKVADMMFILKLAESEPNLLSEQIKLIKVKETNRSLTGLIEGGSYTIESLLFHMIVHSDNEAKNLLQDRFNEQKMWKKVLTEIGVPVKTGAAFQNIVSPKSYSTLFRVLYNASYLSRKMSTFALKLLSESSFRGGIIKGVNDNSVKISTKFGVRKMSNRVQLHESAIIYLEDSPYLITIMTEGGSHDDLYEVLSGVSKIVFKKCSNSIMIDGKATEISDDSNFSFISPLVDCDDGLDELKPFRNQIKKLTEQLVKQNEVENISVFFRHLANGRLFEVNGAIKYAPASLLKIAHMMALLKASEINPELLDRRLFFNQELLVREQTVKDQTLKFGNSYSVIELIQRMIIHSDNLAATLLFTNISNESDLWDNLFNEMGLHHLLSEANRLSNVTAKEISFFLRVLYNATILNRSNSEKALAILSRTTFGAGIRKGVDNNTIMATKFGERRHENPGPNQLELHDLGIVYFEGNPYILCIMTRGNDFDSQASAIQKVSSAIYQEMERQFSIKQPFSN